MPLTPAHVGIRVVVRRVLRGEPGPSGGPALADVLGLLERFDGERIEVRREDGTLVAFDRDDLVTGKPVPPRVSTLLRVGADRLQLVMSSGWPPRHVETLGEWRLRAAGGFSSRANSALPVGDPGVPVADALARVAAFYTERGLPPLLQAVAGSRLELTLTEHGWAVNRPGPGVLVQVASIAQARRTSGATDSEGVVLDGGLTDAWTLVYRRAAGADPGDVAHVLAGPDTVTFASVDDPPVAVGRGVVSGAWLGLAAVEVVAHRRRAGLGRRVVDALLAWGVRHGARSAYLQVDPASAAALQMYAAYGFVTHHHYRYWAPPEGWSPARPGRSPSR